MQRGLSVNGDPYVRRVQVESHNNAEEHDGKYHLRLCLEVEGETDKDS
jgi:hypothetical protein